MGLTSSGDEFCRQTDAALAAIPNVKKLVDDVLIYGQTKQELLKTIRLVFEKCREWNITLSDKKFQFGNEVKFAGFILNESGSSPDPDKLAAIRDFPAPIFNTLCWNGETLHVNTTNLALRNGFWAGDKEPKLLPYQRHIKEFQTVISKRLKLFGGRRESKQKKKLHRTRSLISTLAKKS